MALIDLLIKLCFSETLKELQIFEEVLYSVWEYEETTMDETNAIIRPSSGPKYYWKDICVMETYKRNFSNKSTETLERVSQSTNPVSADFNYFLISYSAAVSTCRNSPTAKTLILKMEPIHTVRKSLSFLLTLPSLRQSRQERATPQSIPRIRTIST